MGHGPASRPGRRRPVNLVMRSFSSEVTVELEAAGPARCLEDEAGLPG